MQILMYLGLVPPKEMSDGRNHHDTGSQHCGAGPTWYDRIVGMGKDWAQRTNIFLPMDHKYRCCAICDDHNRFSYEAKLPL